MVTQFLKQGTINSKSQVITWWTEEEGDFHLYIHSYDILCLYVS
jgi:hypothetical protein